MATYILIGINVLVWGAFNIYAFIHGVPAVNIEAQMGGQIDYLVFQGEIWRVITAMFLHVDIKHLAMNMYALFIMGQLVERTYGKFKYLSIYFLAGIMGNIVTFAFQSGSSMGASGAIFGLVGASVIIAFSTTGDYRKRLLFNAGFVIVASAGMGFAVNINQFAHFGGLIGGLLMTSILVNNYRPRWYLNKRLSIFLFASIIVVSIFLGINNPDNLGNKLLAEIEAFDSASNWSAVETSAEELLALPRDLKAQKEAALWYVCNAENVLKKYNESIAHAKQLIQYNPADGYYQMGFPLLNQGKNAEAKEAFQTAIQNGATYSDIAGIIANIK